MTNIQNPKVLNFGTPHQIQSRSKYIKSKIKNRFRYSYSSHIYLSSDLIFKSLTFLLCTPQPWYLVPGIRWSTEIAVLNFIEIGSDLDIAPIYIFIRFRVNWPPNGQYQPKWPEFWHMWPRLALKQIQQIWRKSVQKQL